MASPAFLAACCLGNESIILNSDVPQDHPLLQEEAISITALVVAIISCIGIFLLLYPWRGSQRELPWKHNHLVQGPNLSHVINCLIISGVLGNLGLIVRSSFWIAGQYPGPDDVTFTDFKHIFCVVASLWVQYFYQASVFWHLVYAMEAYMVSCGKHSSRIVQHCLGWFVSAVFCALGAWVAYEPLFSDCGAKVSLNKAALYCVTLSPVVVVFILDVVLLSRAASHVKKSFIHHVGTYSAAERQIVGAIQLKFILLMTSYTVCSLPNLLNGIFVNTLDGRSGNLILVFLVLESVLNPCQVLLDAMILWGWHPRLYLQLTKSRYRGYTKIHRNSVNTRRRSGSLGGSISFSRSRSRERDPLITFSRDQA